MKKTKKTKKQFDCNTLFIRFFCMFRTHMFMKFDIVFEFVFATLTNVIFNLFFD